MRRNQPGPMNLTIQWSTSSTSPTSLSSPSDTFTTSEPAPWGSTLPGATAPTTPPNRTRNRAGAISFDPAPVPSPSAAPGNPIHTSWLMQEYGVSMEQCEFLIELWWFDDNLRPIMQHHAYGPHDHQCRCSEEMDWEPGLGWQQYLGEFMMDWEPSPATGTETTTVWNPSP